MSSSNPQVLPSDHQPAHPIIQPSDPTVAKPSKGKQPFVPTPAQLAAIEAKRAARAAKAAAAPSEEEAATKRSKQQIEMGKFLKREWVTLPIEKGREHPEEDTGASVRVMSWNMLAQTLVRRELFPGSDCLKWADRQQMLISELTSYAAETDIICLQEVDRLPTFLPFLSPNFTASSARGPKKQHGLVILHRHATFTKRAEKVVFLDEEFAHPEQQLHVEEQGGEQDEESEASERRRRRAGTRETKNIGLMVALASTGSSTSTPSSSSTGSGAAESATTTSTEGDGIIAVTTHLFWHPTYTYERTRQLALLRLSAMAFRSSLNLDHWPIVMAGDFNTQPFEPCYGLMMRPEGKLGERMEKGLKESTVVHESVARIGRKKVKGEKEIKVGLPEWVEPGDVGGRDKKPVGQEQGGEREVEQEEDEEEEDEEAPPKGGGSTRDPMKNTRPATPQDGLLSITELRELFTRGRSAVDENGGGQIISAYDEASRLLALESVREQDKLEGRCLGDRLADTKGEWELMEMTDPQGGQGVGRGEPNWTSFTPLWRLTLDYIFLLPPSVHAQVSPRRPRVAKILQPHRTEDLEPGLPRKKLSASDHVAVAAEVFF